jgi:hypothetical protein
MVVTPPPKEAAEALMEDLFGDVMARIKYLLERDKKELKKAMRR